tara:strand:- start:461 stop:853 length:393 start_codon:yes stop_codon:yes gene_type:complete
MKKLTLLIAMLMAIGGCSEMSKEKTSFSIICNGPDEIEEMGGFYHSIHYDLNLENAEMYFLDKNKEVLFVEGREARFNLILSVFPTKLFFYYEGQDLSDQGLEIDRKTLVEYDKTSTGKTIKTYQCQTLD